MDPTCFGFIRCWLLTLCYGTKQCIRNWARPHSDSLAVGMALDLTRSKTQLLLENMLLRQQLIVLQRQVKRPALTWQDRTLLVLIASKLPSWRSALMIVQPETLLRWHREIFRRVWKRRSKRKGKRGRPPLAADVVALIQSMARENQTWGAERIRGELLKLGLQVAKSTIQRYINDVRSPLTHKQTWATFLRNHANEIWAVDFLQTHDLLFRAVFVFVVIELESRRLVHFGVTRSPNDAWVAQQLREATPFEQGPRFLIQDNDNEYGQIFARVAKGTGIEILRTPFQAPKANAICERFLGSVRRECLDFYLILSERHLYRTIKDYQAYFNHSRPHQGIGQHIPCPRQPDQLHRTEKIVSQPILGGLHHDYRRRAKERKSLVRAA